MPWEPGKLGLWLERRPSLEGFWGLRVWGLGFRVLGFRGLGLDRIEAGSQKKGLGYRVFGSVSLKRV